MAKKNPLAVSRERVSVEARRVRDVYWNLEDVKWYQFTKKRILRKQFDGAVADFANVVSNYYEEG